MDFKLIAIRALDGCHSDFRKNLREGYIYKIYRRYRLQDITGTEITEGGEVENVKLLSSPAEGLYQLHTKDGRLIDLSISAIVGKNGTGKSTISELFFATIYVFSLRAGLLKPNETSLAAEHDDLKSELSKLTTDNAERQIYGRIKRLIKSGNPPTFEKARSLFRSYEQVLERHFKDRTAAENRILEIEKEIQEIERLNTRLKSEIIFSLSKTVLSLKISSEYPAGFNIRILNSEDEDDKQVVALIRDIKIGKMFEAETFLPSLFFYTVAINYSNYSLNSDVIGKWVQWLFHKNDGYRSPLVINPMRTRGEFKIEKENRFAKYRLLSNLLSSCKDNKGKQKMLLTDVQYVKNIRFTLNEKKITEYTIDDTGTHLKGNKLEIAIVEQLYESFFPEGSHASIRAGAGEQIFNLISNYIIQKVKRICDNYEGFDYPSSTEEVAQLVAKLKQESSHIAFKLKQALFFIIHNVSANRGLTFFGDRNEVVREIDFSPLQLLEWMGAPDHEDIINHLPPSIFTIDFELESETGETSMFNRLSSGEQQSIHVIQSILYHIINLQSVSTSDDRISYRALNILFDEVELYFHPEMQRTFIHKLRNAIGDLYLKGKGGFAGINILFLTHSPFILSDIPSENVMRLTIDKDKKAVVKNSGGETFAANINDLLADSFFVDDTLVGAFADSKIVELIDKIKNGKYEDNDHSIIDMIGDGYLKTTLKNFLANNRND